MSYQSPLGQKLIGKIVGDEFDFQGGSQKNKVKRGPWYSGNTSRLQREAGSSILPGSTKIIKRMRVASGNKHLSKCPSVNFKKYEPKRLYSNTYTYRNYCGCFIFGWRGIFWSKAIPELSKTKRTNSTTSRISTESIPRDATRDRQTQNRK